MHAGVWPGTVIARNCCELYGLEPEGLEHMISIQPELQEMLGLPKAPIPGATATCPWVRVCVGVQLACGSTCSKDARNTRHP